MQTTISEPFQVNVIGTAADLGAMVEMRYTRYCADRLNPHRLARSYLDFIRTRPHVHDLAYGPTVAKNDHPQLQNAAIDYWTLLRDTVAACQPPGITEDEVLRRSAAAWGTVYGIARLSALHQIPTSVPTDIEVLIHTSLDALMAGWQTGQRPDSDPTTSLRQIQ